MQRTGIHTCTLSFCEITARQAGILCILPLDFTLLSAYKGNKIGELSLGFYPRHATKV